MTDLSPPEPPSPLSDGAINSTLIDSLDNHMVAAGSIDRAALLPGMYLGWCVRLGLVTPAFKAEHENAVLRLNYGEGSGVELLVSCGGALSVAWLTAQGAAFSRHYYPRYQDDWEAVFGSDVYAVEDSWSNYDLIAPVLTRALYEFSGKSNPGPPASAAGGHRGKGRFSGWKFWQ